MTKSELLEIYNQGFEPLWNSYENLQKECNNLKERVNKNSQNSSKPSSTDIKPTVKNNNSRQKMDKKTGGQLGHKGHTRKQSSTPDKVVKCEPKSCPCGHTFTGKETIIDEKIRQVIDIPEPKTTITEYKETTYLCPDCDKKHSGKFPKEVKAPVQFSNNLKAHVVYLMNFQFLPFKRTTGLFASLHALNIGEGTLANIIADCANRLQLPMENIKLSLLNSKLIFCDESGLRSEGVRKWIHSTGNADYTFYYFHPNRGEIALNEIGILAKYENTVCHDFWKTYFKFQTCEHSLCNAHHLRELQGIYENYQYQWAKDMKVFLQETNKIVKNAKFDGQQNLKASTVKQLKKRYNKILKQGYKETPKPPPKKKGKRGKQARGKALCLLDRLKSYTKEVLDFLEDFTKPFDNNLAERDIRMIKVKQKISGTFRNDKSAQYFCTIRSYIATAIKQGKDIFQSIKDIFTGNTFLGNTNFRI